jgi:hypothetical protein
MARPVKSCADGEFDIPKASETGDTLTQRMSEPMVFFCQGEWVLGYATRDLYPFIFEQKLGRK